MSRHNRDGSGSDQRGHEYDISYQPDWLHQIKVTRTLESGRQSTKTLFRNPSPPEQSSGSRIRTRITSKDPRLDFEVVLHDPKQVVRRVIVETVSPDQSGPQAVVVFSLEERSARGADDDE